MMIMDETDYKGNMPAHAEALPEDVYSFVLSGQGKKLELPEPAEDDYLWAEKQARTLMFL